MNADVHWFDECMQEGGWFLLPAAVPQRQVQRMLADLDFAYAKCRAAQKKNGVDETTAGTVHHLPAARPSFVEFIEQNPATPYIERFFMGPYILNSFGGNFNYPGEVNYAAGVHRDIRTFSYPRRLILNTLVMLDDFTAENGATWLMPRSQRLEAKPSDEAFRIAAVQATGPAGSIVMWDANLWHAAGVNGTQKPRRSVTPMFCVPWMKPGFDYPRALGYDAIGISEHARQVLGYNARIPATLEEWYQPPESRFYKGSQG